MTKSKIKKSAKKTTKAEARNKRQVDATANLEKDSNFILKIILLIVIGSLWIRLASTNSSTEIPVPIGALAGLLFITRERFKSDRKIDYIVLFISMFIGFWLPTGISFIR